MNKSRCLFWGIAALLVILLVIAGVIFWLYTTKKK